jgi:tetratricopeptide (TPR) repeat protein
MTTPTDSEMRRLAVAPRDPDPARVRSMSHAPRRARMLSLGADGARRTFVATLLTLAALALAPRPARAQELTLKRSIAGADDACAAAAITRTKTAASTSASASPPDEGEGRRLAAAGYEAEILGDSRAARDAFGRAITFLPRDDRLAYHLARAQEALGEWEPAARSYCRALELAPSGPDAADARERLRAFVAKGVLSTRGIAPGTVAEFTRAMEYVEAHVLDRADDLLSRVVRQSPTLPEAWYDRGVVRLAQGRRSEAARDLSRYLALRPDAADAPVVRVHIERLQRPSWSPSAALTQGLIVPGLGQLYTRRPVNGLAALVVAGGAVFWAFDSNLETRERHSVDALGFPYTYQEQVFVRPHLAAGLAVAGVTWIGAAVEAWYYARHSSPRTRVAGISLVPGPDSRSLALRVSISR